jgi:hypothetical protein
MELIGGAEEQPEDDSCDVYRNTGQFPIFDVAHTQSFALNTSHKNL